MTGYELLIGMIRSRNQDVLDDYHVTLRNDDLTLTLPVAGDFGDGNNTEVVATSHHPFVTGSWPYHYQRMDLQALFDSIGVSSPTVRVEGHVDMGSVMHALKLKHNFYVPLEELDQFTLKDNTAHFRVGPDSYTYVGELTVRLDETALKLAEQFPNNVLNGLTAPQTPPITDGGNYGRLTRRAVPLSEIAPNRDLNGFDPVT